MKVHTVHIVHIFFTDTLSLFLPRFHFNNNIYNIINYIIYIIIGGEDSIFRGVCVEYGEYVYYVYREIMFMIAISGRLRYLLCECL